MNRQRLLSLLFLIPALLLLLAPADTLRLWRLKVQGFIQSTFNNETSNPAASGNSPGNEAKAKIDAAIAAETIATLRHRLVQLEGEIAAQRIEMRHLTDLRNQLPLIHFYPARVVSVEPGNPPAGIYLDAGEKIGVQKGDGLAVGYVFAGTVVQVTGGAARALLPSSPGSYVPARTQKGRETCAVKADGRGGATAVFYSGKSTAVSGEYLLTSGLLGRIPEGLVIGKLLEFPHRGSEPGTLEAPVQLELDPVSLEDVAVISREAHP